MHPLSHYINLQDPGRFEPLNAFSCLMVVRSTDRPKETNARKPLNGASSSLVSNVTEMGHETQMRRKMKQLRMQQL